LRYLLASFATKVNGRPDPFAAEATTVVPLLASYAYHKGSWKKRKKWRLSRIFNAKK
jgi:hypothetical protein